MVYVLYVLSKFRVQALFWQSALLNWVRLPSPSNIMLVEYIIQAQEFRIPKKNLYGPLHDVFNFALVAYHWDVKFWGIRPLYQSHFCVKEGSDNYFAVHSTFTFYGEVFVEPDSLPKFTKGLEVFGVSIYLSIYVCVILKQSLKLNVKNVLNSTMFTVLWAK